MEKDRYLKVYNENSQFSTIFWMSRMVNSMNVAVFLTLFTFQEAGEFRSRVVKGSR